MAQNAVRNGGRSNRMTDVAVKRLADPGQCPTSQISAVPNAGGHANRHDRQSQRTPPIFRKRAPRERTARPARGSKEREKRGKVPSKLPAFLAAFSVFDVSLSGRRRGFSRGVRARRRFAGVCFQRVNPQDNLQIGAAPITLVASTIRSFGSRRKSRSAFGKVKQFAQSCDDLAPATRMRAATEHHGALSTANFPESTDGFCADSQQRPKARRCDQVDLCGS